MRANDLTAPFHGARRTVAGIHAEKRDADVDEAPLALSRMVARSIRSRALSYREVMAPGMFLCGFTAAALREYPVGTGTELDADMQLEVAAFAPGRAPRGRGIRGRKVAPHLAEVVDLDGLPATTPATTWAMLGRDLSVRKLIILADAILRVPRDSRGRLHPEQAGATREAMQAAIDAGRRVGIDRLREALPQARTGSASPLETEYRLDADFAGLPAPELDVEIRDTYGNLLGISEIVYSRYRVVVEIEGDHHRTSRRQWNRDLQKYRDYANAGWTVVRITASDIRHTRTATDVVRTALIRRGWRPPH